MGSATNIHPKVVTGAIGAQAAALVVWLLGVMHVAVDPVTAAEMVAVLSAFFAWLGPVVKHEVPPE